MKYEVMSQTLNGIKSMTSFLTNNRITHINKTKYRYM